jgi:hypothetical protein
MTICELGFLEILVDDEGNSALETIGQLGS